jgi:transcriptional regulator with XRE-family HTH domain
MSSLGLALRQARAAANLSQSGLAARLHVSQSTISFWERDIEFPTLDHVADLLAIFPDLRDPLQSSNHDMIQKLRSIERLLFAGRCACPDCKCEDASKNLL